ncbi:MULTISPECIES: PhoH family protein [Reichenbachiella]|uniref:PhoH-like ATPase n=1 Tax=Reichenbachiella agariperforans TaxID=156994 RepID=A0A1M6RAT2_REIAG|nr:MULTISPECIES: PhoH family protein [Reichenbachiella]MBU2912873.1 PhoH family protein [Reichenbachiella agariperforans]RJE70619.1 phosphate starvation-inducible protein PhoH [Reichenbachiella sp. MSK19-1]SHK29458.1 PhoH-like ATPase [Reichenbachiella agariperforans]
MAKKNSVKKIFVLDTSVILFSHDSIMNFAEHDVGIPITVLEELDNFKKGNDTLNFEAREFTRLLDNLAADHMLQDWIPLNGHGRGRLKVLMYSDTKTDLDAERIFGEKKNDHKIINAALKLQKEEPKKKVILVSKDINLRLKAKSLDLSAEDYETGKIKNVDSMAALGKSEVNRVAATTIDELYKNMEVSAKKALGKLEPINNCYYILKSSKNSALSFYNPVSEKIAHVEKRSVYGIKPKNAEQAFAIHAMMNPEVKLVAITGIAGTGKTLMALASALQQRRDFKQIYIARPIVPLSNKDIGYLPGDIKSKLNPYMEPLWDNLKFIQNQWKETEKENKQLTEMVNQEKLLITPLAYIRGRSLSNIYFIVDEAQNLTPHEVKTIITRAGENCKIVFTGDVNQIDTPYLDSQSNGLSYLVDRLQGQSIFAHITLEKGERSELANIANELL